MPRVLIPADVFSILEEQLFKLYNIAEVYLRENTNPPRKLTSEIAELEARISEGSETE